MQDKELFNYFKTHATTLDEIPGDALWKKIESGLNAKPTIKYNPFLFITCGIVLLSGIIAYILLYNNEAVTTPLAIPQTKQTTITDANDRITETHPITIEKTEPVNITTSDSVKKIRFQVINTTTNTVPFTAIINKDFIKQSIINPRTAGIKIQNTAGNVIVSTTEKLTSEEFNELTTSMTEQHKNDYSSTLIIKAPGHKTFRKKIIPPDGILKPINGSLSTNSQIHFLKQDTLKLISEKIEFKDMTHKLQPNNVKALSIKNDSIPAQHERLND